MEIEGSTLDLIFQVSLSGVVEPEGRSAKMSPGAVKRGGGALLVSMVRRANCAWSARMSLRYALRASTSAGTVHVPDAAGCDWGGTDCADSAPDGLADVDLLLTGGGLMDALLTLPRSLEAGDPVALRLDSPDDRRPRSYPRRLGILVPGTVGVPCCRLPDMVASGGAHASREGMSAGGRVECVCESARSRWDECSRRARLDCTHTGLLQTVGGCRCLPMGW